ncbi:aminoacyl--tRNA ligase-related protein [Fontibacillus phaseoli]|uniref:aminoacyl--tRNA ligase-related protein n=1 Tax=Fontibacillus phaseoli TaxID=1416533 RepID=UPI0015F02AF1|nr:aminoacyl--tRNA ligase-related protein [Fontibacillus phaseoli]
MNYSFALDKSLNEQQMELLYGKLIYSIEGIVSCIVDADNHEVVLDITDPERLPVIEDTITALQEEVKRVRTVKRRVIKSTQQGGITIQDAAVTQNADSHDFTLHKELGAEMPAVLFKALENVFTHLTELFGAEKRKYPSLILQATLSKLNYIETYPQNIYLVSEIPHQMETLESVRHHEHFERIPRLSGYALTPAACFHCYEELEGQVVNGPLVLASTSNCFRHEAPWRLGKHRMNEFNVKELAFIGDAEFVRATRLQAVEEIWALFTALGLEGSIETASDPFYFEEDVLKGQHQLMADMKYELICRLDGGKESFAISSVNDMRQSLCKAFDIRDRNGNWQHSGCVGFGIERWMYALFATYGNVLAFWPEPIRKLLGLESEDHLEKGVEEKA